MPSLKSPRPWPFSTRKNVHLSIEDPVSAEHSVDLLRPLPVQQESRGAHGEALQHVHRARQALRGLKPAGRTVNTT